MENDHFDVTTTESLAFVAGFILLVVIHGR